MANALTTTDSRHLGPAMEACDEKERLFVEAVAQGKSFAEAARIGGWGNAEGTSTAETYARIGWRVSHRDRVIEALQEVTRKMIRTSAPQAVQAVKDIVSSPFHKDRLKAAGLILNRTDPEITKQDIHVTHEIIDHEAEALSQLRALKALNVAREKLIEVYGAFGLERLEAKLAIEDKREPIDAEYTEIARDPDADLLGEA